MIRNTIWLAFAASLLVAGCTMAPPCRPHYDRTQGWIGCQKTASIQNSHVLRGRASWYGPGFEGRPTASGEPFDPRSLTSAHRTLPFGTMLEVRRGELLVVVRVNDRGPADLSRLLDLSQAAAKKLDMIEIGVAEVEVRILP